MSDKLIACAEHGDCRPAYVCSHILATLQDGQPRGFFWSRDDEGCINAWCQICDEVLERAGGSWNDEAEAHAQITLVCEGCALKAASRNGIDASV